VAPWPCDSAPVDDEALAHFGVLQLAVRGIRNARAEYGVTPGRRITATVVVPGDSALRWDHTALMYSICLCCSVCVLHLHI